MRVALAPVIQGIGTYSGIDLFISECHAGCRYMTSRIEMIELVHHIPSHFFHASCSPSGTSAAGWSPRSKKSPPSYPSLAVDILATSSPPLGTCQLTHAEQEESSNDDFRRHLIFTFTATPEHAYTIQTPLILINKYHTARSTQYAKTSYLKTTPKAQQQPRPPHRPTPRPR